MIRVTDELNQKNMMRSLCNGDGQIYDFCLRSIVGDATGKSLIDLCAGRSVHSQKVGFAKHALVDINSFKERDGNLEFVQADVLGDHPALSQHYDVALSSDGIEHFTTDDAGRLLRRMVEISDEQIIFTPLGPYQYVQNSSNPNTHKSFWYPHQFTGWAILEMPVYHARLHIGAFWVWRHKTRAETENSFRRVYHALRELNLIEVLPLLEYKDFP